jgi:hypothetical protein
MMLKSGIVIAGLLLATGAFASFLPPNNLHLQDNKNFAENMTESEFNEITNQVIDAYKPFAESHGVELEINANWSDSTVNASAQQFYGTWMINMYGGLARRPEVTKDGYALVVCHELGHHFAGFPFSSAWAANEGAADYFATNVCAEKLWKDDFEGNALSRETVDPAAKEMCDTKYSAEKDQDLCYRGAMGGMSLATLLGSLRDSAPVAFDTPDTKVVTRTNNRHPAAQCRLDTYTAGALCDSDFNDELIPGKTLDHRSEEAETEANLYSCSRVDGFTQGTRPLCWYKPSLIVEEENPSEETSDETSDGDNGDQTSENDDNSDENTDS